MKRKMLSHLSAIALCLLLSGFATAGFAQPAIGGPDQCDVVLKVNGQSEVVTIIKDAFRDDQWYYVPNKPRLVLNTNKEPVFSLLKYQIRTESKGKGEGAILQFSVNMALPPESVDELQKLLQKVAPPEVAKKLKIAPLPMSDVKVNLLSGKTGELIAECDKPAELTSSFANSEIPFQLNLTSFGADVYDELCTGNTGVGVWVSYSYSGVTLPASLKITADMEQVYNHVSHDIGLKTEIAEQGLGLGGQVDHKSVQDSLKQVKGLKLQALSGEAWDEKRMGEVESKILEFLYTELFDKENTKITKADPAAAKAAELPSAPTIGEATGKKGSGSGKNASQGSDIGDTVDKAAGGIVNGLARAGLAVLSCGASELMSASQWRLGVSAALKNVKEIRRGKYEFSMEKRAIKQVAGGCGSFIGIGPFLKKNPALKDKLIRTLTTTGGWEYATFALPVAGDAAELGITQVDMTVSIIDAAGKQIQPEGAAQAAIWRSGAKNPDVWMSADSKEITALNFPLMQLAAKYKDKGGLDKLRFQIATNVTFKAPNGTSVLKMSRLEPVFNGEIPFTTPIADFETLKINTDAVALDEISNIAITVKSKDGESRASVSRSTPEAKKSPVFLFTRSTTDRPNPVKATVVYTLKNMTKVESTYNQLENVLTEGPELYLFPEWAKE